MLIECLARHYFLKRLGCNAMLGYGVGDRSDFFITKKDLQVFAYKSFYFFSSYFSNVSSTISASTALTETLLIPFITPLLDL